MRACATANAVVLGVVLGSACFVACSSGSPPETPPPAQAAPPPAAAGSVDMPSETPEPPKAGAKKTPETAADCKEILGSSSLVNEPPSNATVMNNAMTAKDAGSSDRLQGLIDVVKARRDAFRCCFDIWSKKNPGQEGRIMMVWSLKQKGELDKVTVDATKSTLHAPEVEACMINIATGLAYPPSPSAKLTTFSYPFEFRAHNK
ncbi:MAG TPA: AgmX/PglI C-terminal domain-containing protein [Minicystis sp.]|nr:AgmX/PglI C-terminal domain-containing protein [Minicystis sp.]